MNNRFLVLACYDICTSYFWVVHLGCCFDLYLKYIVLAYDQVDLPGAHPHVPGADWSLQHQLIHRSACPRYKSFKTFEVYSE